MPYIDKKELLAKAKAKQNGVFAAPVILNLIEKAPEVDVVEVKHGEWIYNVKYYSCSICAGKRFNLLLGTDAEYCPYCGAKMNLKEGAEE